MTTSRSHITWSQIVIHPFTPLMLSNYSNVSIEWESLLIFPYNFCSWSLKTYISFLAGCHQQVPARKHEFLSSKWRMECHRFPQSTSCCFIHLLPRALFWRHLLPHRQEETTLSHVPPDSSLHLPHCYRYPRLPIACRVRGKGDHHFLMQCS